MVNKTGGGRKAIETQIEKYGSKEALSAEMSRRVKLRKTIGKGGFHDPEVARKAGLRSAEVRRANAKAKKDAAQKEHVVNKDTTKS